ncbi:lipid particle protein [Coprinopsis sp. MPI-PUGE-AT-0042]|nr:lipid particle protein [Coprinopsis sp. MPI-PUGE-AT-0042]
MAETDSTTTTTSSGPEPGTVHLLVLIHGMWGNPGHLAELARIARETHSKPNKDGERMETLLSTTNQEDSTYDGIDWGGERVAQEVLDRVAELEEAGNSVTKLSVTGYSLGGLVARYVVGVLSQKGFFEKVQPINFNTIATPHIGLPRYPSWVSSLFSALGPKLLSRTGEQFYSVDQWSPNGRPLLVVMADPDRVFYQALNKFKNLRIFANGVNDMTVPYVTAAIETEDPFAEHETNGVQLVMDEKHENIIKSWSFSDEPPAVPEKAAVLSKEWLSNWKPRKPLLPPALQLRFPLNLLIYTLLPLLIPTFLSLALIRFSLASRSSRARIKALEEQYSGESERSKLIHILAELEREVEFGTAAEFMESELSADAEGVTKESATTKSATVTPSASGTSTPKSRWCKSSSTASLPQTKSARSSPPPSTFQIPASTLRRLKEKEHPILNEHQHQIAAWLNTLPHLKKEIAFFPDIRNAHAMIISRDVKRFPSHRRGENVIRHWAEHLEI